MDSATRHACLALEQECRGVSSFGCRMIRYQKSYANAER